MIAYKNGKKWDEYRVWEKRKNTPYDYENEGLLNKLLSRSILSSNNPILSVILYYIESSMVLLMKYVDILKNFKNFNWKNR